MNCILTLVASDDEKPLLSNHLKAVEECLAVKIRGIHWLSADKAADIRLANWHESAARMTLELLLAKDRIDFRAALRTRVAMLKDSFHRFLIQRVVLGRLHFR